MSLVVLAKLLGFAGGLLTLVPAIHVLIVMQRANRYRAPRTGSPGVKDLGETIRDGVADAHTGRFTARDLLLTSFGLALIVASFGLDLVLELKWLD